MAGRAADTPAQRDSHLLAGPTAAQLQGRASITLYAGMAVAVLGIAGLAIGIPASVPYTTLVGVLFAAGFITWLTIGGQAQTKLRAEMAAGYSTTIDAVGYDLRDPVTGALLRSRTVDPLKPGRVSFLLKNFRVRPDTWAASRLDDEK